MRERIWLNDGWLFTGTCTEEFLTGADCKNGISVRLPHTTAQTPYNYFDESIYQMICGYRRVIRAPEVWRGKKILLTIGAAGHSASVWLNGKKITEHHCGYTAFTADLSGSLQYGQDNILAVCVDSREQQNIPPFGYVIDYMTYGGLYREVWLDVCEPLYLEDVFVRTEMRAGALAAGLKKAASVRDLLMTETVQARLTAEIRLPENAGSVPDLSLRAVLYPAGLPEKKAAGKDCRADSMQVISRTWSEGTKQAFLLQISVPEAKLWDVESPYLYTLRIELLRNGQILDIREETVGFRHAVFRSSGFWLNGRKLKIRGLNRHQSWPYTGYAMPASMQKMDADVLKKELGLNAVRTSHYPQSQDFISRCDELGLLVFTEIPGWQHIGDEEWKRQAVRNTEEMVLQYRNHPSVILWGVRINESQDDDELYLRTNAAAHSLDPDRPTGGVRYLKKSHLLEDVYTYNDFVHDGTNRGCDPKKKVTSDMKAPYLISEYNGHMFPTKMFDPAAHRQEHLLRHARVLDAVAAEDDIAGSFGWCMADYNTHREFGSGDRICYHGVLDMFRNPKYAAAVYAAQQEDSPVLEVASTMDIGEQPASRPGKVYVVSNAEEVRVYRNDQYICTLITENPVSGAKGGPQKEFPHLKHPPVLLDDFIGDRLRTEEGIDGRKADDIRYILNYAAIYGSGHLSAGVLARAAKLMTRYHMSFEDAYSLYGKHIGSWGDTATVYRFDAVRDGKVIKQVIRQPVQEIHLSAEADHTDLLEESTYDAAAIRIAMKDQDNNTVPFCNGSVKVSVQGPVEIIGPDILTLRGGCTGTYIRTTGEEGEAKVILESDQTEPAVICFTVSISHRGRDRER